VLSRKGRKPQIDKPEPKPGLAYLHTSIELNMSSMCNLSANYTDTMSTRVTQSQYYGNEHSMPLLGGVTPHIAAYFSAVDTVNSVSTNKHKKPHLGLVLSLEVNAVLFVLCGSGGERFLQAWT
jgi:hypothetical protein